MLHACTPNDTDMTYMEPDWCRQMSEICKEIHAAKPHKLPSMCWWWFARSAGLDLSSRDAAKVFSQRRWRIPLKIIYSSSRIERDTTYIHIHHQSWSVDPWGICFLCKYNYCQIKMIIHTQPNWTCQTYKTITKQIVNGSQFTLAFCLACSISVMSDGVCQTIAARATAGVKPANLFHQARPCSLQEKKLESLFQWYIDLPKWGKEM